MQGVWTYWKMKFCILIELSCSRKKFQQEICREIPKYFMLNLAENLNLNLLCKLRSLDLNFNLKVYIQFISKVKKLFFNYFF